MSNMYTNFISYQGREPHPSLDFSLNGSPFLDGFQKEDPPLSSSFDVENDVFFSETTPEKSLFHDLFNSNSSQQLTHYSNDRPKKNGPFTISDCSISHNFTHNLSLFIHSSQGQ